MAKNFFHRVYELVAQVPRGKVATYGQIATLLGHPQAARTVGWALHMLPPATKIPWQRVINSGGRISIPEPEEAHEQRLRLEEEGIQFNERGYIDLRLYLWGGPRKNRHRPPEIIQAGGIVFFGEDVVLRKTAKGEFAFPKGHIELGESEEETALREVEEETGLRCRILFNAEQVQFYIRGDLYRVSLYAMEVVEKTPAWRKHNGVDAFVFSQGEAQNRVSFSSSRQVLRKAMQKFCRLPGKPVKSKSKTVR